MRPIYILVGALIVVAMLVLAVVSIFKPGKTNTSLPATAAIVLADHAGENIAVSYMVDGATNGNESHRAIKITVTNTSRTLEVIGGYEGSIVLSKSFTNNVASYKAFLAGLQTAGFIKQSTKNTSLIYEGKCPLGFRYLLTTSGIKDAPTLLWTTNCEKTTGNFRGDLDAVKRLFKNQIPGYDKLVSGVNL